jgi:hypothetical protein
MKTKKPKRGRPPKENGRVDVNVGLSPAVLEDLDRYVQHVRVKVPGAGRGDILAKALQAFRPFRAWKLRRP